MCKCESSCGRMCVRAGPRGHLRRWDAEAPGLAPLRREQGRVSMVFPWPRVREEGRGEDQQARGLTARAPPIAPHSPTHREPRPCKSPPTCTSLPVTPAHCPLPPYQPCPSPGQRHQPTLPPTAWVTPPPPRRYPSQRSHES